MTFRMPGAIYLGPPDSNWSDGEVRPPAGMVVHIAEGSYQGTIAWQRNSSADVSSYFVTSRAGEIAQMLDLDLMAWTQGNGNPSWVGVENEGFSTEAFTDAQITANAKIFAWLRSVYPSIPARVSNSPNLGGLGWHGMGGAAWGNHPGCPGAVNVALLPTILARAIGHTPIPQQGDDEMFILGDRNGTRRLVEGVDRKARKAAAYSITPADYQVYLANGVPERVYDNVNWAAYSIDPADPVSAGGGSGGGTGGPVTVAGFTGDALKAVEDASFRGSNRAENA